MVLHRNGEVELMSKNIIGEYINDAIVDFEERIRYELDELDPQEIAIANEESDTLEEFCDELSIDIYDIMHEVVDSSVPIHSQDLLDLAKEDLGLATSEPELGPAFDGKNTAINIIAANVFEEIHQGLIDWTIEEEGSTFIDDYIETNEIVLDVGGPSYANYHRSKK